MVQKTVAIIGGGAGGFFSAIAVKENHPDCHVIIFEKSSKLLSKVKISGGGRCNVTNGCEDLKSLALAYPRGGKQLRKLFGTFSNHDVIRWFQERDVPLVTQQDGCVFPESQNSQSIINCFQKEVERLNIEIRTSQKIKELLPKNGQIGLVLNDADTKFIADIVIVATGGSPKLEGLKWLQELGHSIEHPVPSLFTFNMPNENIRNLMGVVVEETITSIEGTKLKGDGPLLITHWGMSGPSILKLSAFGARILSDQGYNFKLRVNWVNEVNNNNVNEAIIAFSKLNKLKQLSTVRPYNLPNRLWEYMLAKIELKTKQTWGEIGKKTLNKMVEILTNDVYEVSGKTTFKEEFVTAGGVALESINMKTMESKVVPNLYFTGEVIDVDGITGGYNFQAAWTTSYIAGKLLKSQ